MWKLSEGTETKRINMTNKLRVKRDVHLRCSILTHPFDIFTKRLTVAGPQDLKLDVGVGTSCTEVHHSCEPGDPSLWQQHNNKDILSGL